MLTKPQILTDLATLTWELTHSDADCHSVSSEERCIEIPGLIRRTSAEDYSGRGETVCYLHKSAAGRLARVSML